MLSGRWLTRANALTGLRLLLAPALAIAILRDAAWLATACFLLAVATDLGDGWLARLYAEASPLGGLVDHAVDAAFVTIATAALALDGTLPAALPLLIAAAFLQYAIDSRASRALPPGASAAPHRTALRRSTLGRSNGIAYYAIVAAPILRDALDTGWPGPDLLRALGWVLVATTILSMADRLRTAAQHRGRS